MKNLLILIAFLTAMCSKASAQTQDDVIFTEVEVLPEYPGGMANMMSFVMRNMKYPAEAASQGVQGRVIVKFVVERDGKLSNITAEKTSIGMNADDGKAKVVAYRQYNATAESEDTKEGVGALEAEAIRVVKAMPKWKPAMQRGRKVRCYFTVPFTFRLN